MRFKAEIDRAFHPDVRIVGLLERPHKIINAGSLNLTEEQQKQSTEKARELPYNEPVAIIQNRDVLTDCTKALEYKICLFSDMLVLKKSIGANSLVAPITAGGILSCVERGSVIFHRRAANSHTHPNCLSMFGGYMNPDVDTSVEENVIREMKEEIGLNLSNLVKGGAYPYLLLEHEPKKDNYQFTFLGLDVSADQFLNLKPDDEGEIVEILFDELFEVINNRMDWAPVGLLLTICWLALGAPISHKSLAFDPAKAEKFYNKWMALAH